MHYVFTMETVWKFQICRISGCRYKSGNGFNEEKVRVEGTNRMQARVQGRGPGLPQRNPKTPESRAGDRGSHRGTRRRQSPGQGPGAPAGEPEDARAHFYGF